jgi:hypothetical protein
VDSPDGTFGIAQWLPGTGHAAQIGPAEGEFLQAYQAASGQTPDYPATQAVATASLAVYCARRVGGTDPEHLWPTATALETCTLFGAFKIDHVTGAQVSHRTVLTCWTNGNLVAVSPTGDANR